MVGFAVTMLFTGRMDMALSPWRYDLGVMT